MKPIRSKYGVIVRVAMIMLLAGLLSGHAMALEGALKVSFRDAINVRLGDYVHLKYPSWGYRTHFGNDVLAVCGSIIYAPGSGVVIDTVRLGETNYDSLGNAVIIRHRGEGRGGSDVFSLILHMQDSPLVSVGQEVTADTIIGRVGMTGEANNICHAHFEIRYFSARFHPSYDNIYGPGNVSGTSTARDNWENPNTYSLSLIPYSHFDGSGSLIDPAHGGSCLTYGKFGCSQDVVKLHPHPIPSTGVFQILSQPGHCDYVKVQGLQSAYIGVKRWSETYPGNADGLSTIYKATVMPVHVRIPANEWVLLSVTTTVPIPTGTRDVSVECQTGSYYQMAGAQMTEIAPPIGTRALNPYPMLVKLPADFHWSGSGSMITHSGNASNSATSAGYGRNRDEAIKLSSKKSLLSFQIYSDGVSCRSVRIADAAGGTGAVVETSVKGWADPDWGIASSGPLPRDVVFPGAGYWIVKIKPAAIGWLKLRATCN